MVDKKRTFRIDVDRELLDKVEEQFCFVNVLGEKIRVRPLSSVCLEAFYIGILQLVDELSALRKAYGANIYLKAGGVGFAELSLDESKLDEEPE